MLEVFAGSEMQGSQKANQSGEGRPHIKFVNVNYEA